MVNLKNTKAAGLITSLVLALAPALILWLRNDGGSYLDATVIGLIVVVINALVKMLQVGTSEEALPLIDEQPSASARGLDDFDELFVYERPTPWQEFFLG